MNLANPESAGCSTERLNRIAPAMQRFVDRANVAGTLTLIARHGQLVHCAATGRMDIEADRPMETNAIFRIFSMTKPVTVVAALMLLEEGRFLLEDPVAYWIPEFATLKVFVRQTETGMELADLERPITLRHLFTHSAGLSYGFLPDHPVDRLYQQANLFMDEPWPQKIRRLCTLPLFQQPGKAFWYSMAHDVLGHIIELISGLPLDVFFQQRIFEPLGMVDTGFWVPPEKLHRLAAVYTPRPGNGLQRIQGPEVDRSTRPQALSGGGGMVSTGDDYLRFAQMLLNGGQANGHRLLSRKTFELLTTPHLPLFAGIPGGDAGFSMGLGVGILTDLSKANRRGSIGAFGWGGAAGTRFWVDPQEDMVGVLMAQTIPAFWPAAYIFESLAVAAIDD